MKSKIILGAKTSVNVSFLTLNLPQTARYGELQQVACVRRKSPATTYNQATSQCASMGGYLASVKTAEKLALITDLAKGDKIWVGLDDIEEEGRYVWQEDASILTQAIIDSVFFRGQPSNYRGAEHCIQLMDEKLKLNDVRCSSKSDAVCEISPRYRNF